MFEIKGKVSSAICYATLCEDEAISQIMRMCNYEFTEGSKIRIMPDVHAGKGCTIGTTMTIKDKVVPNIVGVDIGCGMYTIQLAEKELDFEKIDEIAHFIPSGMKVWQGRVSRFDLTELRCFRNLKDTRYLERSLGTLGGGNHFIEIDTATDGTKYLIIHSGSRNLGKQVAEHYQRIAIDLNSGKEEYYRKKDEIIATYKKMGKRKEIQKVLIELEQEYRSNKPYIPEDLCYLYGSFLDDYLHDVEICQEFARQNREIMANVILEKAELHQISSFHTIHNYIDTKEMILRKGAISAYEDELLLIPINMRDGSVLAKGRGNPDWNYSAPHGAGRIMSRSMAKQLIGIEEYKKSMEGIYTTSVNEFTLDESPMAYKSLEDIIDAISDSVDIVEVLRPVYNFKA